MLTARGIAVALAGVAMWLIARLVGSPGPRGGRHSAWACCPFLAPSRSPGGAARRLAVRRRLSDVAGARPARGRVTVEVDIENRSVAPAPMFLSRRHAPDGAGRPARLVLTELAGRSGQRVVATPCSPRPGPVSPRSAHVDVTDAFGLTRQPPRVRRPTTSSSSRPRSRTCARPPDAAIGRGFGASRARQLLRSGEEYYTMRQYQEGDDLRRIHWASVARTGRAHDPPGRGVPARAAGWSSSTTARRRARPRAHPGLRACRLGRGQRRLAAGRRRVHDSSPPPSARGRLRRRPLPRRARRDRDVAASASWPALGSRALRGRAASPTTLARVRRRAAGRQELPALVRGPPASARASRSWSIRSTRPRAARAAGAAARPRHARQPRRSRAAAGTAWSCPPPSRLTERWHRPRQRRLASSA